MDDKIIDNLRTFKQQFKTNPGIVSVSRCSSSPVNIGSGFNMRSSIMPDNEQIAVTANRIDEDYIKTTGLQIIYGTDFTEQDIKDASIEDNNKRIFHFILNGIGKPKSWDGQRSKLLAKKCSWIIRGPVM